MNTDLPNNSTWRDRVRERYTCRPTIKPLCPSISYTTSQKNSTFERGDNYINKNYSIVLSPRGIIWCCNMHGNGRKEAKQILYSNVF